MRIIFSAFEPFGGEKVNSAAKALELIDDVCGHEIRKIIIPTCFGSDYIPLFSAIDSFSPDAVICLGQAGGRKGISIERVAINVMDASIPDNDGYKPSGEPVVPGGDAAYFSTLPIYAMKEAIAVAGIDAYISNTAGTFVCNHIMYCLLHKYGKILKAGFVHIPFTREQAERSGAPWMTSEDAAHALKAAVSVL